MPTTVGPVTIRAAVELRWAARTYTEKVAINLSRNSQEIDSRLPSQIRGSAAVYYKSSSLPLDDGETAVKCPLLEEDDRLLLIQVKMRGRDPDAGIHMCCRLR
ncbi:hypothetical protein GCM10009741_58230 [Kribbella lupini]|uniref:Uncharacterized protein n=1 Tax=Kribbella lupini TaxID=291602 RepID=A0ABP4MLX5_9ACTN